jgi:hypothetical protein
MSLLTEELFSWIRDLASRPTMDRPAWEARLQGRLLLSEEDEVQRTWTWFGLVPPFRAGGWIDLKTERGAIGRLSLDPTLEIPLRAAMEAFETVFPTRVEIPPPPNPGQFVQLACRVPVGELIFEFRSPPDAFVLDSFWLTSTLQRRWDSA